MNNIGVVVGRFQTDRLHEGHRYLLNEVQRRSDHLVIVLGVGPLPTTCRKPLNFYTRKLLIQKYYPDATILKLDDHPDDKVWSRSLDNLVRQFALSQRGMPAISVIGQYIPVPDVTLYCSRDSFSEVYTGQYNVEVIDDADLGISASLHRSLIKETPEGSEEFARGVIWANENKFPTVYSCVDAAIFNDNQELLVITKTERPGFMFPGGFADVGSTDEDDAIREVLEETGIVVESMNYIGSTQVNDWRYDGEPDEIRTRLFTGTGNGTPVAGDDAATALWVPWKTIEEKDFNPCHRRLLTMLSLYMTN